ncbi:MAG: hypothetical protein LC118_06315 [Dehalococcoidia bacterium]|nr:hypothetical protein [Dehalococcoidia bacterium]
MDPFDVFPCTEEKLVTYAFDLQVAVDLDKDGIPLGQDSCPNLATAFNSDADGDGYANGCDQCDCDPGVLNAFWEEDRDGVCTNACDPKKSDNCPTIVNKDQANCNADAEEARSAERRGDGCDPVPCPRFVPQMTPSTMCGITTCTTLVENTSIAFRPRGAFETEVKNPTRFPREHGVPEFADTVSTKVSWRYCLPGPFLTVECLTKEAVDDAFLAQAFALEDQTSPWHRVRLLQGESPIDEAVSGGPYQSQLLTGNVAVVAWDYPYDLARWRATSWGASWVPNIQFSPFSSFSYADGRFWMNTDRLVGMAGATGQDAALAAKTGVHRKLDGTLGEKLSNHYEAMFPYQRTVDAASLAGAPFGFFGPCQVLDCGTCVGSGCVELPDVRSQCRDCPLHGLGRWRTEDLWSCLLVRDAGSLKVQAKGAMGIEIGDDVLGPDVRAALAGADRILAPVETLNTQGGSTHPDLLLLNADGTSLIAGLSMTVGPMKLSGARGPRGLVGGAEEPALAMASALPPGGASDPEAALAYSRSRGLLFRAATTPTGATQLAVRAVDPSGVWQVLEVTPPRRGAQLGRVLGLTYDHEADELWLLDEVRGPGGWRRARLLRRSTTGQLALVGSWPRVGLFDRFALGFERDGDLLLFASSGLARKTIIAAIDRDAPSLKGLVVLGGRMTVPPGITAAGISIATEVRQGKKVLPDVVHLEGVPRIPRPQADLDGFF